MHKQKHLLSLLTLGIVLTGFISCTKKTSPPAPTPTPTPTPTAAKVLYCKLNGVEFTPLSNYYSQGMTSSSDITIYSTGTSSELVLYFKGSSVGTYALNGTSSFSGEAVLKYTAGDKEYRSYTGELKLSKIGGDKISGTFHFEAAAVSGATDTIKAINGEFNDLKKI